MAEEEVSIAQLALELQALKNRTQNIVVVQKEKGIQKFTGDGSLRFADFERQVRAAWAARPGISAEEKLDLVWSNLSSSIRDELQCHPPAKLKVAEGVLEILRGEYGEKRSVSQLLGEFHAVTQRPGEGVREFSHRLNRAFLDLTKKQEEEESYPLEGRILRDHFVSQLNSHILRRQLRERVHQNPRLEFLEVRDEAIRWAEEGESGEAASVQAVAAIPSLTGAVEMLTEQLVKFQSRLAALEVKLSSPPTSHQAPMTPSTNGPGQHQGNRRPVCYKCGKPGHFFRNCRSEN